jgi:hypothetical protein
MKTKPIELKLICIVLNHFFNRDYPTMGKA